MPNLKILRIQAKLDELFENKIDLSDATNPDEKIISIIQELLRHWRW